MFYTRGANATARITVGNDTYTEHPLFGKRRADDYKTDGSEEQASGEEEDSAQKLAVDDVEESVVPKKTQVLERCAARR